MAVSGTARTAGRSARPRRRRYRSSHERQRSAHRRSVRTTRCSHQHLVQVPSDRSEAQTRADRTRLSAPKTNLVRSSRSRWWWALPRRCQTRRNPAGASGTTRDTNHRETGQVLVSTGCYRWFDSRRLHFNYNYLDPLSAHGATSTSESNMSLLAPTPPDRLVDAKGRPYFLWDEDLTIDAFRSRLRDSDPEVRAYYRGKLMRQAKPDDVFTFVTLAEITELFPFVARYLGRSETSGRGYSAAGMHYPVPPSKLSPLQSKSNRAVRAATGMDPDRRCRTRRLPHQAPRDPRSRSVLPSRASARIARRRCDSRAPVCRHERQRSAHHPHLCSARCSPRHRVRRRRPLWPTRPRSPRLPSPIRS
jgi:hypothetical protein